MRADDLELGRGVEPAPPPDRAGALAALVLELATTAAEVREVVRNYTCRWPIEEIHLTLKSGCEAESLRLKTWDGLEKAFTVLPDLPTRRLP